MDVSTMKASQLPLDFSLNVKAEGVTNLNIHVKTAENGASMLISPDKSSQSAFKVVTPKHADGKLKCNIRDFNESSKFLRRMALLNIFRTKYDF